MHSTLAEILENQKTGLLWVSQDGVVRYANGDACSRTGLAPGGKLYDPDLARAVMQAVLHRASAAVTAAGRPAQPGEPIPELSCRVVPGLSKDDAFVFIRDAVAVDPGIAFENLMQIIQSDLAAPLHDAQRALGVLEPEFAQQAEPLLAGITEVLQVLDKLVDLAGLWSSSALLANDRIELWPLLQSVWAELQPQAMARQVQVRFQARDEIANLATLYGSEPWMRRVFLECLEAAIRAAPSGSTLMIEHRQFGPRALLVFRNSGVFAQIQAGIELRQAPRGRAGTAAARERIGFHLCRQILALHGGQLRDEIEDGERHLLIDLPTGAPHRPTDTQIDIAQAQRYASDLAALMARSRRRQASH
ncbi:sensor histidine kinase [Roseateles saccharophilus]|uniref:Signal transduction histidine kinase n=1 Tax=Roseateles saccharophilus TaxID=304 RepID=A0A4R3UVM2_ROSSA|nr:sensor histidine kinase [Roseateles saccharophilus]MDG0835422.1 sensor histidine kinase [Roseateles saccharophilus]TCU96206.1 signal transduction histidine kinase [Roseateles saccharophilus]